MSKETQSTGKENKQALTLGSVSFSSCKYHTTDCINRQIGCGKCKDMSNYEWDYTCKY